MFNGQEKKPPSEIQAQVETLVRRYSNAEIRNNGERFRYQGLAARYTTFNELWQKKLRAREEGKRLRLVTMALAVIGCGFANNQAGDSYA